jgi:hypothetical protein
VAYWLNVRQKIEERDILSPRTLDLPVGEVTRLSGRKSWCKSSRVKHFARQMSPRGADDVSRTRQERAVWS